LHAWDWDLSKIIGCLFLILIYSYWTKMYFGKKSVLFFLGILILFLSLVSPLDALGDEYLFSAHMLQHFLLLMIVPLLLLLGLPEEATRRALRFSWVGKTERFLSEPWRAFFIGNLVLWIWHVPSLYDWAIENESVHIAQHLTFLVSATIFWWPVLGPLGERRLKFDTMMVYLFLGALSNMALGILLTFSGSAVYAPYLSPVDQWKILSLLRYDLHLSPLADQKLGGILMWVLGPIVFLAVILAEFANWYQTDEGGEFAER
jgi:cytochrome c oxidase assembly factor CtaG